MLGKEIEGGNSRDAGKHLAHWFEGKVVWEKRKRKNAYLKTRKKKRGVN